MASQLKIENYFDTLISNTLVPATGDITVDLGQTPTYTRGYIVFSSENSSQREIAYFHNRIGNTIYIAGVNRINPKQHVKNETARINDFAEFFNYISNNTSQAFYVERTGDSTVNVFGGTIMVNENTYTLNDTTFTLSADGTYYIGLDRTTHTIVALSSPVTGFFNRVTIVKTGTNMSMTYAPCDMTVLDPTAFTGASVTNNITTVNLTGEIKAWSMPTLPNGWLRCDGTAVSRGLFPTLFSTIVPSKGTITVSIATPGVISKTAHGLFIGDAIYFTTTGALPTGITANTLYYIISAGFTVDSFQISTTFGGSAINTSGTQSGVHTMMHCPYGLGNGSTTFNVPDLRGKIPVGWDSTQTEFANIATTGGAKTHVLTINEMPSHNHDIVGDNIGGGVTSEFIVDYTPTTNLTTNTTIIKNKGGGQAHNNLQPYLTINYIIAV